MNMKRAFLAAVAVFVMVPGLVMAQGATTFPGSFTFSPDGPAEAEFNLALTCNGGTPLSQEIAVSANEVVNFSVLNAESAGAICDFALTGLPDTGWDLSDNGNCTDIAAVDGVMPGCIFVIEPTPFNFWANVAWMSNSDSASDIPPSGELTLECADVWNGTDVVTVSDSYTLTDDGLYLLDDGTYAPHPDGSTLCNAMLTVADSAVEVSNTGCTGVSVEVGDPAFLLDEDGDPIMDLGEVVICDIEASVFFEGIPTLSQYGMAIMVLLMLGVGFVGFRRFV